MTEAKDTHKEERHSEAIERREGRGERNRKEEGTPWYSNSKVWLWVGVVVFCALLLYWVLFMAIWDGPNQ